MIVIVYISIFLTRHVETVAQANVDIIQLNPLVEADTSYVNIITHPVNLAKRFQKNGIIKYQEYQENKFKLEKENEKDLPGHKQ
jgi:hypothetical protein